MKVVIAMSGGVDSSVAVKMMLDCGYDCVGMTMRLYKGEEIEKAACSTKTCCGQESVEDARLVASTFNIPFYAINFEKEFWKEVVEVFAKEYSVGRTPSPCILCNEKLKFKALYDKAKEIGAQKVCTGHYARIEYDAKTDRYLLLRGKDNTKDQSYFLFSMTQQQLSQTLFPLGSYSKQDIRQLAKEYNLITHNKPESQDICFVPDQNYVGFLQRHFEHALPRNGPVKMWDGSVIGHHLGIHTVTIGQRRGLGVFSNEPLYVTKIDAKTNTIFLGSKEECFFEGCVITNVNWIYQVSERDTIECSIKVRSRGKEAVGTISVLQNDQALVQFEVPQMAVTEGQAAVFYQGEYVIGGGWIEKSVKTFKNFDRQSLIAR
ncbi:MAG: tRNA-specific 2-thiouridylase MnmA [Chlamydiae bacterium]|nr:tRNA-specific 2-thiouridylase MnmA [Chlamydiota bacterium]